MVIVVIGTLVVTLGIVSGTIRTWNSSLPSYVMSGIISTVKYVRSERGPGKTLDLTLNAA